MRMLRMAGVALIALTAAPSAQQTQPPPRLPQPPSPPAGARRPPFLHAPADRAADAHGQRPFVIGPPYNTAPDLTVKDDVPKARSTSSRWIERQQNLPRIARNHTGVGPNPPRRGLRPRGLQGRYAGALHRRQGRLVTQLPHNFRRRSIRYPRRRVPAMVR